MNVLVLDCDGVVVHPTRGNRWDDDLERDLGIAPAALQAQFFARHWRTISHGEADMFEVLERVWPELGARGTARAFVDYWFARDARVDAAVLGIVGQWRARDGIAVLGTVQEHHRAKYLWETIGLQRHFDAIHYSAALGAMKPDVAFYERLHAKLPDIRREDVIFLDDAPRNVEAARAFGWQAHHFTNVDDLRRALTSASPTD